MGWRDPRSPEQAYLSAAIDGRLVTATVDALLPLWFALVKLNGGNRRLALGIVR